jgi:uncharacterized protein YhaN
MKLISCYIENFGGLHEYKHTFKDGLNVILEENGWGKTTFASFIKVMFYGMDYTTKKSITENERKRFMPWQGGNYGGYAVFETNGRIYRIERFFGAKDKDDKWCLYDEVTGLVSKDFSEKLGEELFGIDAAAYERSTYIPQELRDMGINDSLTSKLNKGSQSYEKESYEKAVELLDEKLKFLKKTGDRGRIAELETRISDINHEIESYSNRTQSYESLKEKKAELETKRIELFDELKSIREEVKKSSEYEGLRAKKNHYDSLVRNNLDAKSRLDGVKLFFDKPELIKEFDKRKDDYDNLDELETKYRNEKENLNELEYKKHGITAQYMERSKTPIVSFVLMLLGILVAGSGVLASVWLTDFSSMFIMGAFFAAGLVLFLIGLFTWIIKSSKLKKSYNQQLDEVEEMIDCAKISLRELAVQKEFERKKLENYLKCFQVEDGENLLKSFTEISGKIKEYDKLSAALEEAGGELASFEAANEMDKIIGLAEPKQTLAELQKREGTVNTTLVAVMEEKNALARRMDILMNDDEDEADLLQEKEYLTEELKKCRHEYEIYSMTKEILATANENYKTQYIDEMKNAFAKYVSILNGTGMDNVSVDVDMKVIIEEYGSLRNIESYSAGYRDMLLICTRFALVKAMFKGEQPFLILDDPFVNLDKNKIKNALAFLNELSKEHQLLYFTCHESRT